jgi:hypothetical protein
MGGKGSGGNAIRPNGRLFRHFGRIALRAGLAGGGARNKKVLLFVNKKKQKNFIHLCRVRGFGRGASG